MGEEDEDNVNENVIDSNSSACAMKTRGCDKKLSKEPARLNKRYYLFSQRKVNTPNALPINIITA